MPTPNATVIAAATASPSSAACLDCHSAQGALKAWGIRADYIEKDAAPSEHLGIVCAVCHDPHGSPNSGQLRFPIDVPSQEQNLCVKCHHKRAEPETQAATLRGPHSPEGPLLLGEGAGWFPPNFQPEVDRILSTHGSDANPRLCATCHVAKFTVTDQATGDFVFNATGHLFNAIPCVDAQGIPTPAQDCAVTERTFVGCTTSGCHGSVEAARSAFLTANQRILDLTTELDALLALPGPGRRAQSERWNLHRGGRRQLQLAVGQASGLTNPQSLPDGATPGCHHRRRERGLRSSSCVTDRCIPAAPTEVIQSQRMAC